MSRWALYDAESNKDGTVDSWAHSHDVSNMSLGEAAEWTLEEMGNDNENAVVVSGDGTIEKWIMPAPRGENRKWW